MDGSTLRPEALHARRLLRSVRQASLATQSEGQPYASLVTPAIAPDGAVLLFLSALSGHARHLGTEPRCALLFAGPADGPNPQTAPRVTVSGTAEHVVDAALKAYWLRRHPYASLYADLPDFSMWRMLPTAAFYVGGFARAAHLPMDALLPQAEAVAALATAEPHILAHCNADHAGALGELAAAHGGTGAWTMLNVDCDGFDLVQGDALLRIAFAAPVHDASEVRDALVALLSGIRSGC